MTDTFIIFARINLLLINYGVYVWGGGHVKLKPFLFAQQTKY